MLRVRFARRLAPVVAAGALLVVAACGKSGTGIDLRAAGGPAGDAYSVEIVNAGAVTLQALSIVTGEDQPPLEVAQLAAGQRTAPRRIGVLHENPVVRATVGGRRREFLPVEGFTGFNPSLEPGRYVIRLRWNAETEFLETTVQPVP